jgi:hypothetical protein
MALNDNARLRQLVGDYYHGLISLDSYRQQRADLLDNIGVQFDEQSDTDHRCFDRRNRDRGTRCRDATIRD